MVCAEDVYRCLCQSSVKLGIPRVVRMSVHRHAAQLAAVAKICQEFLPSFRFRNNREFFALLFHSSRVSEEMDDYASSPLTLLQTPCLYLASRNRVSAPLQIDENRRM